MHKQSEEANAGVIGPKPVLDTIRNAPETIETVFVQEGRAPKIKDILDLCRVQKVRYRFITRERMDSLFPGNHQGVAAKVFQAGFVDLDSVLEATHSAGLQVAVALDQVQDPGNVGVLARTLLGLGGAGLILPKDRSAALGFGAAKASAGALASLPVAQVVNLSRALDQARDLGFAVVCTGRGQSSENLYRTSLSFPCVLVLGNEDRGVRPGVAKRCTTVVEIPLTAAMESLNVAQAGAIILGEMWRRTMLDEG
ncbi:MAG: TrmH family RNA methyltransferase [Desulfovibrionales bacterium]